MTSLVWRAMTSDEGHDFTFGQRLRQARGRVSRAVLARRAGVSERAIAGYEAGEYEPKLEHAAKLAVALNVPLDQLAGINRQAPRDAPRQVVLLIDGEPWIAHAERRTESRDRLAQALEDAQAFEASRDPQVRPRDRRRRTR
jgi:transcriptional regulator with XRE-family HTH domain